METFSGGSVVEDFAGAFVEHILNGTEFLVRDRGEIETTGEVVAEAVVLAFAGGAFPRAVSVTEVDFEFEVGGEWRPSRSSLGSNSRPACRRALQLASCFAALVRHNPLTRQSRSWLIFDMRRDCDRPTG